MIFLACCESKEIMKRFCHMRPRPWTFATELTQREESVLRRFKKRPFYAFLRRQRNRLFDEGFQEELAAMYQEDSPEGGRAPVSPPLLALVTLLQAYTGASDADAVELALADVRWRIVLGLLDVHESGSAPFSQGTLVAFRNRLVAHGLDRRLLERTVELARETGEFGHKQLRLALDASPLFTAGRVEDTFNLLGHATRDVLDAASSLFHREIDALVAAAGTPLLASNLVVGCGSLKANLDVEWERPEARLAAFDRLVREVLALKTYLAARTDLAHGPLASSWSVVEEILGQDVEPDPEAGPGRHRLRKGTAAGRRPSVSDSEARHGRKSKSQKFTGFKRHLALDLDTGLVLAVAIAPANKPEGAITEQVAADLVRYLAPVDSDEGAAASSQRGPGPVRRFLAAVGSKLLAAVLPTDNSPNGPGRMADDLVPVESETLTAVAAAIHSIHVDRAYLGSALVRHVREAGGEVFCKPFPQRGRPGMFTKAEFTLSLTEARLTCPAGHQVPASPGETSRFPAATCQNCPLRERCTSASRGRSVHIHADEPFFETLRARQRTPEGRAALRQRVAVEHALAREIQIQGRKARYRGIPKNLMALRLGASIVNLQHIDYTERKQKAARSWVRVA
jgi:hypothetical protein